MARIRDPDRSRRKRRRAADKISLLHQQRLGAANGRKQRGRHAGGSGADDNDVVARRDV
jgi:hypothetical protein